MTNFFESESFPVPSQLKGDVATRLKDAKGVKSVEFELKGDAMEGGKEFSRILLGLKKRGVKISHEFRIKLDFPHGVSKDQALTLVENMPKPKNGSVKVRVEFSGKPEAQTTVKS